MKLAPSIFTVALMSAFAVSASAQTAASSPTRAEVKAEAAAANKAGTIPHGQESVVKQDMPKKPMTTANKADVKKEAAAANKSGSIPSGQESVVKQDMPKKPVTEANKAEVKAEAAAANKAGATVEGQASPGQDKGPPAQKK